MKNIFYKKGMDGRMQLEVNHITKQYKDKTAVNDVSITFTPGVWGLLGANGAGKTTLMRMVAGIMQPSEGKILYDGIPIDTLKGEYRRIFGYLPQEFGFYPEFTVQDYLEYMAALKGMPKREGKKKIVKLSGGMKRRVGIAQALLNDPEVLILDEPTSGLDPGERVRFRNLLSEFARDRIVVISTHIVSDVEYIANQNAIMKDGSIIENDTTENLVHLVDGKIWECQIPSVEMVKWERMLKIISLRNEADGSTSIRYLADQAETPDSVPAVPRLEDLYLWLFQQEGERHA